MLFILDGSNSMWGQVDGVAKIATAQDVLGSLLTDLPEGTEVGLMVYGHRDKGSCSDIELLSPIGADDAASMSKKISGIQPKGKTPIADALSESIGAFSSFVGGNNHVVLISDGLETCSGDPCAAAGALNQANIQARVHVIGFDVSDKERKQLECIPEAGNGKYFSAGNASELKTAVAEVKEVATKVEPEPAPPPPPPEPPKVEEPPKKALKEVFRDDFKSDGLSDHWEVVNPDPEAFIVEEGGLLMVAGAGTPALNSGEAANVFKLSEKFPKGDWVLSASFDVDFQTGKEAVFLGIFDNEKEYMAVQPMAITCGNWSDRLCYGIEAVKVSGDKVSRFEKWLILEQGFENYVFDEAAMTIPQPIELRIVKTGRKYRPGILWRTTDPDSNATKEEWVDLEAFTQLRLKGKPAVGMYQKGGTPGESAATADWVRIQVEDK